MSTESTLRTITRHLGLALAPLQQALVSPDSFRAFCFQLGFDVTSIPAAYGNLVNGLTGLLTAIEQDDVNGVVNSLKTLAGALGTGFPAPDGTTDATDAGRKLLDLLVIDYLKVSLPTVFQVLRATGVVTETFVPAAPGHPSFVEKRMDYDQVPNFLSDPLGKVKEIVAWGAAQFGFPFLAGLVVESANSRGFRAHIERPDPDLVTGYLDGTQVELVDYAVDVILFEAPLGDTFVELGVKLLELPGDNPGLALHPLVPQKLNIRLSDDVLFEADTNVDQLFGILFRPGEIPKVKFPLVAGNVAPQASVSLTLSPATPKVLIGSADASRIEIRGAKTTISVKPTSGSFEVAVELATIGTKAVLDISEGDGFLSTVLGAQHDEIPFDLSVRWSSEAGITFGGSGKFEVSLSTNLTLGPVHVNAITVGVSGKPAAGTQPSALIATAGADMTVSIGPVAATVSGIGVELDLGFSEGNIGPFNLDVGFRSPDGVGIVVDAGSVHGGGFISSDRMNNRYVGALQLSVYDIAVSAFGLIETKLPTGPGYSFVLIISAQFTPIQLGFGFTLNGVGGMVGINRSIDTNALANLVRAGQSEELLFPKNVISDAPTIVKDLTAVFPATQGKYVFGPLGKLGWGTPTLITGEIGIILEYPALVVVLLGEVKCLLPKPEQALVKLNLSIDGVLDFPNKTFSMDADLHDSVINGFPVSGQMAMRVSWGDQPNFVFSIGGFHPAYTPPPNFPKLQPMTLDLGSHGAAKISVSGFFAVTSNTVQVGGSATLHAGGSGITLDASASVKALFVFQPFSFEADIDASVKISFHGYGPSVHLSGQLDGPSPWHIKGEVCVSIIWWDACLGFDVTFGGDTQITAPSIDPWLGAPSTDPTADIVGLQRALSDPGNWSGAHIPGTVSSVARAQGTDTLVDPVGGLTVRQKTAPVETPNPLTKFGVAKTTKPITFSKVQATLGTAPNTVSLTAVEAVNEDFAPAQFFDMDDGKKLSSAGFEQYQAGYLFATADGKNAEGGSSVTFQPTTRTLVINSDGTDTEFDDNYKPTDPQVTAFNKQSAIAKGGLAQAGTRRFVNRAFTQSFSQIQPTFVITDSTTLAVPTTTTLPAPAAAVRSATLIALDAFRTQHVELALGVQVTALHDMPP